METGIISAVQFVLLLLTGGPDNDRTEAEPPRTAHERALEDYRSGVGTLREVNITALEELSKQPPRRGNNK
jgi:hypothetical protein